ncbi:hypothetical protein [Cellulomonas fengjieae]|uniref:Uncharacterized protein n=1 Tax=Cellulomonas fengjieae TaxID=2819978 RepID=A0ABS3SHC5_9CELL|nr:hypothetical protein [Cellulomonas fengjieae]MBO3085156.1 hypothetical protein [Cellulomonas fengjieae]MBO3100902.1 hypothetical protein [Cellulomonas fengjieae]QVI66268.1 hypothetical protein KG102_01190 [Cellulomonas fengjieae]
MHPDLAIAMYRHQEHELEVRLEQHRTHLEKSGKAARAPHRHRPHLHPLRARR